MGQRAAGRQAGPTETQCICDVGLMLVDGIDNRGSVVACTPNRYGEEITRLRVASTLIDRVLETAARMRMGPAIVTKAEQVVPPSLPPSGTRPPSLDTRAGGAD